jgi:HIV-1 Vpr-binding protein
MPMSASQFLMVASLAEVVFNSAGNVIYGLQLEQEVDEESKFETSFKTFDAGDYSIIATTETKKSILGLCPSWDDLTLAVVEQVMYRTLSV